MSDPLVIPYATVAEAEVYNGGIDVWDNADLSEQQDALYYGRVYIDSKYTFYPYIDENDIPAVLKQANSLLAVEYLTNSSIFFSIPTGYGLKRNEVKADTVESRKEYHPSFLGASLDKFPKITALLALLAKFTSGGGGGSPIVRQ